MIATVCSAALGLVFVVAGANKVAIGRRWQQQAGELGAPAWAAPIVPWVELVVGALLISQVARRWVASAALALLLALTALLVLRLREGKRPPCACFGAWSSTPLGWFHVARNAVFVALAIGALAG